MKRKLLIVFFAALFFIGIIYSFQREPSVEVGKVTVFYNEKEYEIKGQQSEIHNGSKSKTFDIQTNISDVKNNAQAFDQSVVQNQGKDAIQMLTNILVSYYGRVYSSSYTIYDFSGNILQKNENSLNLPTKNIDGCIVKVDVTWGRKSNYKKYTYFFRTNVIKFKLQVKILAVFRYVRKFYFDFLLANQHHLLKGEYVLQ